ncbi:MAG: hypothetical protein M3Z19_14355 [Chloroflexota bacterium]|nr:hypothetical protein [Chloroflexota bacterium]
MIGQTFAMLITIAFLTVAGVAVLGRLWRFVLVRPPGPTQPRALVRRVAILPPGTRDFAEQQSRLVRFDLPLAAIFLVGSLYLLATPGVGGAWLLTFAFWCGGAVTRWLTPSARIVPIRCAMVVLLVIEAVLVLLIRGGGALPQALVYLFVALVGASLLYAANELPLPFAPQGPYTSYRRGARPDYAPAPRPQQEYGMHFDTMPALAPRRPMAQVTPINYARARRNPMRVREDEGAVVSPPYYASYQ